MYQCIHINFFRLINFFIIKIRPIKNMELVKSGDLSKRFFHKYIHEIRLCELYLHRKHTFNLFPLHNSLPFDAKLGTLFRSRINLQISPHLCEFSDTFRTANRTGLDFRNRFTRLGFNLRTAKGIR